MKSRASLFLAVLLLALSLTACGKEPAKNDRNDAGSGQNSAYDAVSDPNRDNVPNNDAIIGRDDHTVTAPDTNPAPNPANEPAGDLPGARLWTGMLRNGAVSMTGRRPARRRKFRHPRRRPLVKPLFHFRPDMRRTARTAGTPLSIILSIRRHGAFHQDRLLL